VEEVSPAKVVPVGLQLADCPSRALVFPKDAKKTTHVEFSDMERLREHEFLNDNLIEFYIRYLQHYLEQDRPEIASKIYFFNTFFYERLTKDKKGSVVNFNAVAKWTSKVDLFGYDFVVVPINESAHWYLAIICNLRGLERKIASPESARSESEDEVAEKDEDTKESKPRSTEPRGADERLPLDLRAEAEESNEDARESFASLTLGEEGGYSITKGAKSDDEEKDWPSEGENGESHSKEMLKSTKEGTPAEDTAAKSSPAKSSKGSSTGKKGRKTKRRSFGPKYDPEIPAIITLDSLISQRGATIKALKEYLREEAKAKRSMKVEDKDLQGINAKGIPTQQNFSDCGLFLLAYLEMFLKDPKEFVAKIMRREMSEAEWPPTTGYELRERLRKMIQRLHDEQQDKKLPNKEEDKFKRDTCEEGFTLLGPKKEPSPEPADVNLSPEHDDHPSYEPTPPKNVSFFDAKIRSRFHDPKKRESIDPISLDADDQSPKMVNKTKIQVHNSQDEAPESVDPHNVLAQQLASAAKTAVDSGDEVVEIEQKSRSSSRTQRRTSVDTDFVRDPNRSYELALQSEQFKDKDVVDLDESPGQKSDRVQPSPGRGRKSHR
jgi:sentrin-specific protease 7